jgi:hypothetical protein
MRPRKLDHFKGFNFYVVEDLPHVEPSSMRDGADDGDEKEAEEKPRVEEEGGLKRWFEVRKEVLPADEDDERVREDPTWKVSSLLSLHISSSV